MSLVIPPQHASVKVIFNRLGGAFEQWLQHELNQSLLKLADAQDETVMRQYQGRTRFIRDMLDQIHASQQ